MQDFFQNNRLNVVKKEIKFILFCSLPDYTAFFVGASIQSRDHTATTPRPVRTCEVNDFFGTKFVILFLHIKIFKTMKKLFGFLGTVLLVAAVSAGTTLAVLKYGNTSIPSPIKGEAT